MAWYNLLDWFKRPAQTEEEITLSCDSPQCAAPIKKGPIVYDLTYQEIYHTDECRLYASAHHAFTSARTVKGNVKYISFEHALALFREGTLSQTLTLEERISSS